ncbi:MAG TPA: universal stress protein [Chloroflexota bacterium]|nr:universal stress protein [Chloroflexota bacterium]
MADDVELSIGLILFPTDFTEVSRKAQRYVSGLARQLGAKVHVLHVIESIGDAAGDGELDAFYASLKGQAERQLDQIVAALRFGHLGADWQVILGRRVPAIIQRAQELPADLIVMGSHGLRPDRQFLPGSTSQRVPLVAPCPVLLVPS